MLVRTYYDRVGVYIKNRQGKSRGESLVFHTKLMDEHVVGAVSDKNVYYKKLLREKPMAPPAAGAGGGKSSSYIDPFMAGKKDWGALSRGGVKGGKSGGDVGLDTFGLSDSDIASLAGVVSESKNYFKERGSDPFKTLDQALYKNTVDKALDWALEVHNRDPNSFLSNLKASSAATLAGVAYGALSMFNPYTWVQGARFIKGLATSSRERQAFLQSINLKSNPLTAAANLGALIGGFAAGEALGSVFRPSSKIIPDYISVEETPHMAVDASKPLTVAETVETGGVSASVSKVIGESELSVRRGLAGVDTYKPFYRRGTGTVKPDYVSFTERTLPGDKWVRVFREKGPTVKGNAPEFKEGTWRFKFNDYDVMVEQRIKNKLFGPTEFERRIIALDRGRGKVYGLGERTLLRYEKGRGYVYERSGYEFDPTLEEVYEKPLRPSGEPGRFPSDVYGYVNRSYGVPFKRPLRPILPFTVKPPFLGTGGYAPLVAQKIDTGTGGKATRGTQGGSVDHIKWHPPGQGGVIGGRDDTMQWHPPRPDWPKPRPSPRPWPRPPDIYPGNDQDSGQAEDGDDILWHPPREDTVDDTETNGGGVTRLLTVMPPPYSGRGLPSMPLPPPRAHGRALYWRRRRKRRLRYWEIDYGDVGIPFVTGL